MLTARKNWPEKWRWQFKTDHKLWNVSLLLHSSYYSHCRVAGWMEHIRRAAVRWRFQTADISRKGTKKQDSPPAWPQEAYRPAGRLRVYPWVCLQVRFWVHFRVCPKKMKKKSENFSWGGVVSKGTPAPPPPPLDHGLGGDPPPPPDLTSGTSGTAPPLGTDTQSKNITFPHSVCGR